MKATASNMLFMIWRHRTIGQVYRRGIDIAKNLAVQFPEGVGVCQVVEVAAEPPNSDARAAFVEFLRLEEVKHLSVIHDGTGFKAASIRAVMSGVHSMARAHCKHSVFSDVGAACRWHMTAQAQLGHEGNAEEMQDIVRDLRSMLRDALVPDGPGSPSSDAAGAVGKRIQSPKKGL